MKILVIKFRNIGDVLLTTPLISNLHRIYPEATIDVAVNQGTEAMLEQHPAINYLHIYDRDKLKKLTVFKRIQTELTYAHRIRQSGYDIVINTTNGDRGIFLALFSGAQHILSYPSKKNRLLNRFITHPLQMDYRRHMVENHLEILSSLDHAPLDAKVEIFWDDQTDDKINRILKNHHLETGKYVHIHPVSRWLFKCVEDSLMASVIDYCQEQLGLPVVLTAAPVPTEQKKIETILSLCHTSPINLSGTLSLKETAALNANAAFFVGVDTAIMHISAANDVPVLALFGPSGAFNWGPWDNSILQSQYRKINGIQQMGQHTVLQVDWECAPCYRDGCNGSKISDCLMSRGLPFATIRPYLDQMANRNAKKSEKIHHG